VLKLDILGLRTLTVIDETLNLVRKNYGVNISHFDLLDKIHDKTSFDMICKGWTQGIFQLEGQGMTQFMRELKPQSFSEVSDGVSLYRPGPLEFIPIYLKNRINQDQVSYLDPRLEKHLKDTYGIITYQEQCMLIAIELANYSEPDSDDFRRAIGKKKEKEIKKHKELFINGATEAGLDENIAKEIFSQMENFGKYA